MSNYITNLALTRHLATEIQTLTGITTIADNATDSVDGLYSSCLLLTCTGTQDIIAGNATARVNYTLGYITQPEQQAQADIHSTLDAIYNSLVDYLGNLATYDDLGGAVYLAHDLRQWSIEFDAQSSTYILSFDLICQL